jgi:hypothetical protein
MGDIPGTRGLLLPEVTPDGKLNVANVTQRIDLGWPNYWSDHADDLDPTPSDSGIGDGAALLLEASEPGDVSLEWQYNAPVQAHGGQAWLLTDFDHRDHCTVDVYAPASPVAAGGTQNCVLAATGAGFSMIVPVTPGSGTHEVDLEATLGSSGVTVVVPVTASDDGGYFDYDLDTGAVTPNYDKKGNSNLFDGAMTLTRYLNKVRVRTNDCFSSDLVRMINPQWKWRATLTQGGGAGRSVQICFRLALYRKESF